LALTIVGPEAGRRDSTLGGLAFGEATGLAAPGLPLGGFGDDWAKPVMTKPNPNIVANTLVFIISV
tara:strand:- start:738 stop:935 length:198 start_codon:yes stop_codon:yes gene_type:complete